MFFVPHSCEMSTHVVVAHTTALGSRDVQRSVPTTAHHGVPLVHSYEMDGSRQSVKKTPAMKLSASVLGVLVIMNYAQTTYNTRRYGN